MVTSSSVPDQTSQHLVVGCFTHRGDPEDAPGKHYRLGPDGTLAKETVGWLTCSHYVSAEFAGGLHQFAEVLQGTGAVSHLTAGSNHQPTALAMPKAYVDGRKGLIARTDAYLPFRPQPTMMVIDCDAYGDPYRLREELRLDGHAMLVVSSSSSHVAWPGGNTGARSLHAFVVAADGRDVPRALDALHGRLLAAGRGQCRVSGAGAFLERTAVDRQLRVPSQPIYIRAHLGPDITQEKTSWWFEGVPVMDTRTAVPDLNPSEVAAARSYLASERERLAPEMCERSEQYRFDRVTELVKSGTPEPKALAQVNAMMDGGALGPDVPIYLSDGTRVTVREILTAPATYHGRTCRDPLEPHRGSRSQAKIYTSPKPVVRSFARGGRTFQLNGGLTLSDRARRRIFNA